MLPLSADHPPANAAELAEALTRGLQEQGVTARQIEGRGASLAEIEMLRLDLTDAHLTRDLRPAPAAGSHGAAAQIAQLEIIGAPLYFESTPLELRLTAERCEARLETAAGRGTFAIARAGAGALSMQIAHAALEALLHSIAREAAAKQGVEVRQTKIRFTQEGPRAVSFRAEVVAKVFIMTPKLALTGRFEIDDGLKARLSNLALDGDAIILSLASGFARPHLERLEGRTFPLLAFSPAGLKVQELEFTASDPLQIRARFGAA